MRGPGVVGCRIAQASLRTATHNYVYATRCINVACTISEYRSDADATDTAVVTDATHSTVYPVYPTRALPATPYKLFMSLLHIFSHPIPRYRGLSHASNSTTFTLPTYTYTYQPTWGSTRRANLPALNSVLRKLHKRTSLTLEATKNKNVRFFLLFCATAPVIMH